MITQTLSEIIKDIDRTVFTYLDGVSTNEGYSVDRTTPGIRNDKTAWRAAELAIVADKGFVVGIRSSTNSHDTNLKEVPRIVYHPQRVLPGNVGFSVGWAPVSIGGGNFQRQLSTPQSSDYYFQISGHAQKPEEFRVVQSIIATAITHKNYLSIHNNPSEYFMIEQLGFTDAWDNDKGTYDVMFQFKACDILTTGPKKDDQILSDINNIKLCDEEGELIAEVGNSFYDTFDNTFDNTFD